MSKITLSTVSSGFLSNTTMTTNFTAIQSEFQNKVLYRDNPDGEPNTMMQDLDMNGFRILNALAQSGDGFLWMGTWASGVSYALNNLVTVPSGTYTGYSMIAKSAFTSLGTFDLDYAAGRWDILASRGATGASGSGSGDLVAVNNLSEVNPALARSNLGAAASGANTDITSLVATSVTVAVDDKVLIKDTSASDVLKTVTVQSIADLASGLPSGTRMTFNQTSAPTGWTKDTTAGLNDSIMRIVTGTVGSGGSTAFSTFNGQTATGSKTLTTAELPPLTYKGYGVLSYTGGAGTGTGPSKGIKFGDWSSVAGITSTGWGNIPTSAAGGSFRDTNGGGAHSHGMTTAIKYNDFIIATKD